MNVERHPDYPSALARGQRLAQEQRLTGAGATVFAAAYAYAYVIYTNVLMPTAAHDHRDEAAGNFAADRARAVSRWDGDHSRWMDAPSAPAIDAAAIYASRARQSPPQAGDPSALFDPDSES